MTFAAYFEVLTSASNHLRKRTSYIQKIIFFLLSLSHYSIYLSVSTSDSFQKRTQKEAKLVGETEHHVQWWAMDDENNLAQGFPSKEYPFLMGKNNN